MFRSPLWSQISQWSSWNFVPSFWSYKVQLITFPKRYLASKSIHGNWRYFEFWVRKPVRLTEIHPYKKQCEFQWISQAFWHKIKDISGLRGWILTQDSVLETLLVALFMIKNLSQNFNNFIIKLSSKVEISWKSEHLKWIFSNNSEVSSYLLGHILLFWNVSMQAIQWPPKINLLSLS
jgi:hypothetical protein